MLREYPNNVTFHDRGFIEQLGGYFLDSVAMGHELRLPRDAWRTFYLCELIHRGVADLTLTVSSSFIIVNAKASRSLSCPPIRPRVSGIQNPHSRTTSGECVAPSSLSRASAPARPMPVLDTFETSRDVRYSVAIGGKTDVAPTSRFCSD